MSPTRWLAADEVTVPALLAEFAALLEADRLLLYRAKVGEAPAACLYEWRSAGSAAAEAMLARDGGEEYAPACERSAWPVSSLPEGPLRSALEQAGVAAALLVPLLAGGGAVGCLEVHWTRAVREPTDQDRRGISVLSRMLALLVVHQRAEEALRESEARFKSVSGNFTEGMLYQLQTWPDGSRRFTFVSESVRHLHGVPPEAVLADPLVVYGHMHPDDVAAVTALEREAERTQSPFRGAVRVRMADGHLRWSSLVSTPRRQRDGSTLWDGIELLDAGRDAAEALRVQEERLRLALEATSDGVWDWNLATGEVYLSPRYYRALGYEPGAFPSNLDPARDLIHPDDRRATEVAILAAIERDEGYQVEFRMKGADGAWRWMQSRGKVTARGADGHALRLSGTDTDVTARRLADEERASLQARLVQAQKLESVGRLAGGVAHDFNNNLTVILGYVDSALGDPGLSEMARADLIEIREAAERSSELTRQLLTFARKQPVAPKVVDLNRAVTRAVRLLQRLIGEGIRLEWWPDEGAWPVKIDPGQFDQVVTNLCVNARDAITGAGKVVLSTGTKRFEEAPLAGAAPGDYTYLSVTDDGCGMSPETQSLAFEPFFTTKEFGKGTGLGLATVYGIVQQSGGFLRLVSAEGKGSTFEVYLPRHREDGAAPLRKPEPAPPPHAGSATILLVEDEAAILRLSGRLLQTWGYHVLSANTPAEAQRLSREHQGQIDLLLTDVILPEMNGRQLYTALLESRPGLKCIYMSGYTADVLGEQGVVASGLLFLQKPFTTDELAHALANALAASPP